jgi:hypothetical protein
MKTRHVKHTSNAELVLKWKFNPHFKGFLFIVCNAKGEINWDKAIVYTLDELLHRGKVKLL